MLAIGISVLGFAGSYVVHTVNANHSKAVQRALYSTAGLNDGQYSYTYAASDDAGTPIIVGDGILTLTGGDCHANGRVYVGQTPANPNSDPADIHTTMDEAESVGVGRNGELDGVESVLLPNGSNGGAVPAPWLDDTDITHSFCSRILHQLETRQPYVPAAGSDTVSVALLAEDTTRGLTRLTGSGVTSHQDPAAQTRTELVVGNGTTSIVIRLIVDELPAIVVSQVNLQPYPSTTRGVLK
jgi:hypothetical protein